MGKNNKRKTNNGQPRYTGKNINYMGDASRMEKHAVDIFREMSRGKYNTNNLSEFNNRDFVLAAIKACERNIRQQNILVFSLNYTYGTSTDPDVIALKNKNVNILNGWIFVRDSLIRFNNSMDFGGLLGMVQHLATNRELRL